MSAWPEQHSHATCRVVGRPRMIEAVDTPRDLWLVFEKGGDTLSSLLFDVQGESYRGSRIYHVRQRSLLQAFAAHVGCLQVCRPRDRGLS